MAGNIWWPRAKWGEHITENCPIGSQGKATRLCQNTLDGWQFPNTFNCTSNSFVDLQRLVSIKSMRKFLIQFHKLTFYQCTFKTYNSKYYLYLFIVKWITNKIY